MQLILAMLVALAVSLAPAFSRAGEASAAVGDRHAQMMDDGHCKTAEPDSHDAGKSVGDPCCASTCMGVAISPAGPDRLIGIDAAPDRAVVAALHLPHLAEIATPPPRLG